MKMNSITSREPKTTMRSAPFCCGIEMSESAAPPEVVAGRTGLVARKFTCGNCRRAMIETTGRSVAPGHFAIKDFNPPAIPGLIPPN